MNLLCPLCGRTLCVQQRRCVCAENHSFDIARQGYVNLLPVQQKHSRHPGDTRQQVLSRREFLEAGSMPPSPRRSSTLHGSWKLPARCWMWAAARAITAPGWLRRWICR